MLILVCFCTNEAVTLREKGEDEVRWDDVTDVFNAPPRNSPRPASSETFAFGFIYLSDDDLAS